MGGKGNGFSLCGMYNFLICFLKFGQLFERVTSYYDCVLFVYVYENYISNQSKALIEVLTEMFPITK